MDPAAIHRIRFGPRSRCFLHILPPASRLSRQLRFVGSWVSSKYVAFDSPSSTQQGAGQRRCEPAIHLNSAAWLGAGPEVWRSGVTEIHAMIPCQETSPLPGDIDHEVPASVRACLRVVAGESRPGVPSTAGSMSGTACLSPGRGIAPTGSASSTRRCGLRRLRQQGRRDLRPGRDELANRGDHPVHRRFERLSS